MDVRTNNEYRVELLKGFDNKKASIRTIPVICAPVIGLVGIPYGETEFSYTPLSIPAMDRSFNISKSTRGPAIELRTAKHPNIVLVVHGRHKHKIISDVFTEEELEKLAEYISSMIGGDN